MIKTLSDSHSVTVSCQAMSTPPCSYYHFAGGGKTIRERKAVEDTLIRKEIEDLINDFPKYGYRMMTRHSVAKWQSRKFL